MPFGGLTMAEALGSRRRDFSDLAAGPTRSVTFKRGSTIKGKVPSKTAPAPDDRPWYKRPITYVFGAIVAALVFGPSLMTHGGRARTPRPFGRG